MTTPPGRTYSPARAPTPRRPPRPFSVMPIVAEYPPSIRNVRLDIQTDARPASVWSSDDDDVMRRRCAAFFRPKEEQAPAALTGDSGSGTDARKRRLWLILGIVAVGLIIIAAVVGGVLGSRVRSRGEDIEGGKPAASAPSESGTTIGSIEATVSASSEDPKETGAKVTIQEGSKIGSTIAMPFEDPYRVVVFLNADGHLATSIWTGSKMETFPVTSDTDSGLPKPAKLSPLHLIVLYQSDAVNILYVDEDHYLSLATMPARGDRGKGTWRGGRIETGDDGTDKSKPERHQTTGDLRVTFEIHNNADDIFEGRSADRVNILYEEGSEKHRGKDKYTLLSTVAPDDPTRWFVNRYQLSEGEDDPMNPQKGSQGLVLMPTFKDLDSNPRMQSGVRIIWDLSNKDHDSSFGVMKCKVKSNTELNGCWFDMGHWETEEEHDQFLAMPKPLSFTYQHLINPDKSDPQAFVLLVLDGRNVFTELYWDGSKWNGMRRFLAVEDESYNATRPFSSIAITDDGSLFGVSDGKLRWYVRLGSWWKGGFGEHDAGWKLVEVVNTTLVDAGEDSSAQ